MSLNRSEFSHYYGNGLVKVAIISGFFLLLVSLSADVIGLGDSKTLGQSQIMGGVAGFTLMVMGLFFYFRKRFGVGIVSASLVLVSVCTSLAGAEIALRLTVSQRTAAKWNPTDEVFWKFNWLDYGDTRTNARITYHPTLGWGPAPGYRSEFFNLNWK